ncbi:hypothetical protein V6Z11_A07G138200 [Gossypium hirsutum]
MYLYQNLDWSIEPLIHARRSQALHAFNSLRDRSRDILSVVVALLFGVGCGSLTAAAIYLVWIIFTARCEYHEDDESDEEFSPKKMGYVNIPANPAVNVKDD